MDIDEETRRFKSMLFGGVVFLVSLFFSWSEMKYSLFGAKVDASIVRVYEVTERGRRGREIEKLVVEYEFADADGSMRREKDRISIDAERPMGRTVAVQFLKGSPGSSRLAGNTQRIWLLVFFASLAYIGFKIFQIIRLSKA